jgi:serpin B
MFMKNNILKAVLVFSITIPLLFVQCSKNPQESLPTEPVKIDLTPVQVSLVGSGNSFAFDIFREVVGNAAASENIMISPLSISYALSMALNGAYGTTQDSMFKALRINDLTPEELNNSFKNLTKSLLTVDQRVLMAIANSVWIEQDFLVKQSFIDILTRYYNAESREFDIDDSTVPDKINAWIEDKTNGLIKDMIDKLDDNTVMLLINAIYFKGKWKLQFDKNETDQKPFYKPGGSSAEVPTMIQTADFKVYDGDGFILGEFPYGQGNFVMDIILPDAREGASALLPSVTDEAFTGWIGNLSVNKVDLYLPRFKYGYKKQLNDILTDMGMGIAFNDGADFTNIADYPPLIINRVLHQSFIETNEEGTEAAAVTTVEFGTTSYPPPNVQFNADHAFLYIIRETTTNTIIFMGRVADPTAE